MKKFVHVFLVVLLIVMCNVAFAERKVEDGIEYWTEADSDLTTEQLTVWMKAQPMKFIIGGLEEGLAGQVVEFGIFDIKAPENNTLQIKVVRVLLYRYPDDSKPYTLAGYTIYYTLENQKSYKIHTEQWKYMKYDYKGRKFEHEKGKEEKLPEAPPEIPIIPQEKSGVHA